MTEPTQTFPPGSSETPATVPERARATGEAPAQAGEELAPGTRVGRYVVLGAVGSGGMGRVYAAHDPELNRKVALKLARRSGPGAEQWRARFLREAHAMASLSHPNVLPIHDVGTHEDSVFLAMELVEGPSLREWLSSPARPPWRQVARVFADAGRGLAAAHAIHLVHRDFKPANVLLGRDGRARVMDFGLVRALGSAELASPPESPVPAQPAPLSLALTRADTVMGTVGYMAPEQQRARAVDARADQFSFAVAV
ncbi:MAG TPA: serine/threonine-protein kinase, partial [Myxococcales bacterium]|nr:serine/threonine-protein kinase [Myxococcales bacterium]